MSATETPRVYVACLASYNSGWLHGKWIDADQDAEDIRAEIAQMLKESPEPGAEEWAIHDFEGFGGLKLSEHEDMDKIAELGELIEEHPSIFGELVSYVGGLEHLEYAKSLMEEGYAGEYDTLENFAEDYLENSGQLDSIPEDLQSYFDFEKYGKSLQYGGDIFTIVDDNERVHVFWNQ